MKRLLFAILIIFSLFCCIREAEHKKMVPEKLLNNYACDRFPKTVLIHGTLFPILSNLTRTFDIRSGLHYANTLSKHYGHGRAIYLLGQADKKLFPIDYFYAFGWSGNLSFKDRKNAAINLYNNLKNFERPINLVCHSHGGNVALLLDEVVRENHDYDFKIDKLILLATPVQKATESYIYSNVFKNIYSLYSAGDLVQVMDPQGLYIKTRRVCYKNKRKVPLFSKRIFPKCFNVKQAKVLINGQDLGHLDFILRAAFIQAVPNIISILDEQDCNSIYVINISDDGKPCLVNY